VGGVDEGEEGGIGTIGSEVEQTHVLKYGERGWGAVDWQWHDVYSQ